MPNTSKKKKVVLKLIKERKTIWQFYYFISLVEKRIPIEYQWKLRLGKLKTVRQIPKKFKESTSIETFADMMVRLPLLCVFHLNCV